MTDPRQDLEEIGASSEAEHRSPPASAAVRIRLCVVSARFPPARVGGAERQMERMIPLLRRRGVEVFVLTGDGGEVGAAVSPDQPVGDVPCRVVRVREGGIAWRGRRRLNSYGLMAGAAAALLRRRAEWDLVQVLSAHELAAMAQGVARLLGRPCVVKITGGGERFDPLVLSRKPLLGRVLAPSLRRFDRTVVTNPESLRRCVAWGLPPDRLAVIPNGVAVAPLPSAEERRSLRAGLGLGDELVIVAVSNLIPVKRLDLLVDAIARVRDRLPPFRVLVLGEGAERAHLLERIRDAGLARTIELLGRRDPVDPYLAAADLAVHPSDAEGMSNAILEAMSCGLPVIAADIPGNRQLIEDGRTGVLFARGEAQDLAAALAALATDPPRRLELGSAARCHVRTHHSLEATADAWTVLYRSVLGEASGVARAGLDESRRSGSEPQASRRQGARR